MPSVRDTVKSAIWQYPSLFHNRTEVLHHLFCVLGNGFDWEDGELVDRWQDERPDDLYERINRVDEGEAELRESRPEIAESFEEERKERLAEADYARANIEILTDLTAPLGREPYPPLGYHGTANGYAALPEDAKPDWAEAYYEIMEAVNAT